MLKQLRERGTSLSGYKAPPPSSSSTERAFFVGEQRDPIYLEDFEKNTNGLEY